MSLVRSSGGSVFILFAEYVSLRAYIERLRLRLRLDVGWHDVLVSLRVKVYGWSVLIDANFLQAHCSVTSGQCCQILPLANLVQ